MKLLIVIVMALSLLLNVYQYQYEGVLLRRVAEWQNRAIRTADLLEHIKSQEEACRHSEEAKEPGK
jgi:hypothetical protein